MPEFMFAGLDEEAIGRPCELDSQSGLLASGLEVDLSAICVSYTPKVYQIDMENLHTLIPR